MQDKQNRPNSYEHGTITTCTLATRGPELLGKYVKCLLDIVVHRAPLCKEDWYLVPIDFNHWEHENDRPIRSLERLKDNFDKLAYA